MNKDVIPSLEHLKVHLQPGYSFSVRHEVVPFFFNKLHYHAELELFYIIKGTGKQFIGDTTGHFKSGDMVLVGENLPHLWRCDEKYLSGKAKSKCEAYVIHFTADCFGKVFFHLPENIKIAALFERAKQGIAITGATKQEVVSLMRELPSAPPSARIILLIKLLDIISTSTSTKTICRANANLKLNTSDSERINVVYQYIMQHFDRKLSLKEVAAVANLSPNSFCRFFKSRINKSFSQFLIEIRIGHACSLLEGTKTPVAEICFECGYNSFSNFNKHFKNITKKTPLQYRNDNIVPKKG
jgi:AraC-like DNA-binding protein